MNFEIDIASKRVNVKLKRSINIKHCYLKIIDSNSLIISANTRFSLNDAKELLAQKSQWIFKHITRLSMYDLDIDKFLYLGKIETLSQYNITDLNKFYKETAIKTITPIVEDYSRIMNLYPKEVKFRKNRSRWGSCNSQNVINLNYFLMKLPIESIEYVIVHELAHIKHKHHQKEFWKTVEKYMPDYKKRIKMMKGY